MILEEISGKLVYVNTDKLEIVLETVEEGELDHTTISLSDDNLEADWLDMMGENISIVTVDGKFNRIL